MYENNIRNSSNKQFIHPVKLDDLPVNFSIYINKTLISRAVTFVSFTWWTVWSLKCQKMSENFCLISKWHVLMPCFIQPAVEKLKDADCHLTKKSSMSSHWESGTSKSLAFLLEKRLFDHQNIYQLICANQSPNQHRCNSLNNIL